MVLYRLEDAVSDEELASLAPTAGRLNEVVRSARELGPSVSTSGFATSN